MKNSISVETIEHHIRHELLNDPEIKLQPDLDLLLSGLLDSLNVVKLVSFLEQHIGISIPPEDVLVEHFGSINLIMSYLGIRNGA